MSNSLRHPSADVSPSLTPTSDRDGLLAAATPLQEHMAGSYFTLRVGIGIIGAVLPVLLWLGGKLLDSEALRASMSAYYYSPSMRDKFVGALVTIGVFLYLYRGFSKQENWALNLGGVFAVGVALVPTAPTETIRTTSSTFHGTFAVLFFLCIAYVAVFRASDTLSLMRDTKLAERYQRAYRSLGIAMIVSPLAAVVLKFMLQPQSGLRGVVFFVEAVGVWVFSAYWLVKSAELRATDAEALVLEGKVKEVSTPKPKDAPPGRLVQVAL